jgi:Sulfotransferase family
MYQSLIALERDFDRHLGHPRVRLEDHPAIPARAAQWSRAVWTAAAAERPLILGRAQVQRGLDIALRPIFICGTHRSGTTLVRDLLDGHPTLAVLPSEATFFTSSRRALSRHAPERWLELLGCEWLRRLANPIHQAPYWVLGRSSPEHSPYVHFARCLMAWWPVAMRHVGATASSWPLTAIALAYAQCTGGLGDASCIRHWAEKSPTNERFLDRLRMEFPRGRVIHVIRHPLAVLASRAREARNAGQASLPLRRIARDLERSYRIAAERARAPTDDRYLLVRYEDLLATPPLAVERLAGFLGIDVLPILLQPTVASLPVASNSSFHEDAIPGRIEPGPEQPHIETLSRAARERICAILGDSAAQLGYQTAPVPAWRRTVLRVAARLCVP